MRRFILGLIAAALLVPAIAPMTSADSCPAKTYVYTHQKIAGQRVPIHGFACTAQGAAGANVEQIDTALITPGSDVMQILHAATTVTGPATLKAVVTGLGYNGLEITLTPRTCCVYQGPDLAIDPVDTVAGGSVTVQIFDGTTLLDTVVYHTVA